MLLRTSGSHSDCAKSRSIKKAFERSENPWCDFVALKNPPNLRSVSFYGIASRSSWKSCLATLGASSRFARTLVSLRDQVGNLASPAFCWIGARHLRLRYGVLEAPPGWSSHSRSLRILRGSLRGRRLKYSFTSFISFFATNLRFSFGATSSR